jgi:hypothetical protein
MGKDEKEELKLSDLKKFPKMREQPVKKFEFPTEV